MRTRALVIQRAAVGAVGAIRLAAGDAAGLIKAATLAEAKTRRLLARLVPLAERGDPTARRLLDRALAASLLNATMASQVRADIEAQAHPGAPGDPGADELAGIPLVAILVLLAGAASVVVVGAETVRRMFEAWQMTARVEAATDALEAANAAGTPAERERRREAVVSSLEAAGAAPTQPFFGQAPSAPGGAPGLPTWAKVAAVGVGVVAVGALAYSVTRPALEVEVVGNPAQLELADGRRAGVVQVIGHERRFPFRGFG